MFLEGHSSSPIVREFGLVTLELFLLDVISHYMVLYNYALELCDIIYYMDSVISNTKPFSWFGHACLSLDLRMKWKMVILYLFLLSMLYADLLLSVSIFFVNI